MVDNHPQFCGAIPDASHPLARATPASPTSDWDDLCADAAELLATKLGEWRTQPTARDLRAVTARTLPALLRHVFEAEARACGKERLFIKENHTARFLPFLLAAWPDAQFVHLVRDPRDMALSWKRSAVHRGDVVRAARVWQQDQAEAVAAIAQLQDVARHCLTYEDLVVVPELELLRLCRFLGRSLPARDARLPPRRPPRSPRQAGPSAWENLASR